MGFTLLMLRAFKRPPPPKRASYMILMHAPVAPPVSSKAWTYVSVDEALIFPVLLQQLRMGVG